METGVAPVLQCGGRARTPGAPSAGSSGYRLLAASSFPASAEVTVLYMRVRDIIKLLERDGWYLKQTRGSHRQYKHKMKPGRVTLPGHPNDDLPPGTLNSVLKQAGLKP